MARRASFPRLLGVGVSCAGEPVLRRHDAHSSDHELASCTLSAYCLLLTSGEPRVVAKIMPVHVANCGMRPEWPHTVQKPFGRPNVDVE